MKKIMNIIILVIFLSGCTTLGDVRMAKGTGVKQVFDNSFDKTWNAAICSINSQGLIIAGDNQKEGYILAQRGMTVFSYGENVAIFLKKINAKKTEVEVISKRVLQTNITATNWSPKILNGIRSCF